MSCTGRSSLGNVSPTERNDACADEQLFDTLDRLSQEVDQQLAARVRGGRPPPPPSDASASSSASSVAAGTVPPWGLSAGTMRTIALRNEHSCWCLERRLVLIAASHAALIPHAITCPCRSFHASLGCCRRCRRVPQQQTSHWVSGLCCHNVRCDGSGCLTHRGIRIPVHVPSPIQFTVCWISQQCNIPIRALWRCVLRLQRTVCRVQNALGQLLLESCAQGEGNEIPVTPQLTLARKRSSSAVADEDARLDALGLPVSLLEPVKADEEEEDEDDIRAVLPTRVRPRRTARRLLLELSDDEEEEGEDEEDEEDDGGGW